MYEEAILKRGSVSNRGLLLRCALLTAILFSVAPAIIAQEGPQSNTGALRASDASGKPVGECPLKHTTVKAEVSGFISRVTVTQDFENPFTEKIEAVYVFPLPQAAAVDDLTMLIGERTIKGKIMRREEAQATYANAKQLGQVAALLDQQRPNIFSQAVANIMPGQQIRIVISYVETLKYEDGSYEWSFPMVVGHRYNPATLDQAPDAPSVAATYSERPGHDISIDLTLDAGVPIEALNSETHETEVERPDGRRAIVRLKDQKTIPNKDFILTYQTAGPAMNDAVLAHRTERGGFFTLILQPPQRVPAEDVTPKELVFVVDTSGSMSGFPLAKAKETVDIALDTLYQHDTFNIITFSGDTNLLFPEPRPATPENVREAKKFLASHRGGGGTEMMKAITAALQPTDSQQHLRITCFLTDGYVGNDMEIIAEVKKYKNARVFAMGFGVGPNRYLLDNMAQHGRGEVDYVTGAGDTSAVARRFNERVRNPYLTDISIEWPASLSVADIYPRQIPDMFSAKPLVLSGRYLQGGSGSIVLKGKIAGQDYVREIQVALPETEGSHDVLATLWARRKIDDVMAYDLSGAQYGTMKAEFREEIEQIGLKFKLMTQFTSFVAVDETTFTGPQPPVQVAVPQHMQVLTLSGVSNAVMVSSSTSQLMTTSSVINTDSNISNLPVNGRSFANFLTLTPGTVSGSTEQFTNSPLLAVVTNGQRTHSNMFIIDGVSADFGITPGGQSPGSSASGNMLAVTASGGANGVATIDSIQEITFRTAHTKPEHGRVPGVQVDVVTRAGTNEFHGSLFHAFGNDATDANDWFANSRGLNKPPLRVNNFGGTFAGPLVRDKAFFFGSYEGLRLRNPMMGITDVPSLASRAAAAPEIRPFINAFPLPTGEARPDGFAEFASTFANSARHDVGSFRVDWNATNATQFSGRYSFADSDADTRGAGGFSLNTVNRIRSQAQTTTGSFVWTVTPRVMVDVRANYSRLRVAGSQALDSFGGAVIPSDLVGGIGESFNFDLNGRGANLIIGSDAANIQRQLNTVGSVIFISGKHDFKLGADYRRMSPLLGFRTHETNLLFDGVGQAITGIPARVGLFNREPSQSPDFNNLSLYAQDEWRKSSRLTLNYGVRWELNPAPSKDGTPPLAVDQVNDPTRLAAAASGTPLWKTTFLNFAPRVGVAYQLLGKNDPELMLRGGFAVVYDLGQHRAADAFADSIPFVTGSGAPAIVFDPQLKLPYTLNWNVSLERALGSNQSISGAYVGTSGRRLLHTQTVFDQNTAFPFLRLTTNAGRSDYRALQVEFNRRFSDGLKSAFFYTWARSLDNVSEDSARHVLMTSANPALDRGPSDFDVRHQFNGYVQYDLPALFSNGVGNKVFRNWSVGSIVNLRSAKSVNVVYLVPTPFGVAYFRPNVVSGEPLFMFDPTLAGGKTINPAAFDAPSDLEQGNLGRNSLRGFPLHQIDLALRRAFNFSEQLSLQFRVDVFNVFNHPNFADPVGRDRVIGGVFPGHAFTPNSTFGRSSSLLGQSLSDAGFGSFYNTGGPRTMRFSLKLIF
ncbi:MAG TPA: TonB-dependent receptor [Pyrinomonadaceae bacterium]|nr:TonB-dependent receptor [Pyrinomonadaceae bacterium]